MQAQIKAPCGQSTQLQQCRSSQRRHVGRGFQPFHGARSCNAVHDGREEVAGPSRRELLAAPLLVSGLSLAGAQLFTPGMAVAEDSVLATMPELAELYDPILAYRFQYPTATMSGKPLKMILSHPPEKYSSAAPLTADARQRIVCELLDLRNFVSVSMTVGPASGVLKSAEPGAWKARDVALTVLIDRSTSRLTTGQRTALNDIERANAEQRDDGSTYYVYEHVSQGSPTIREVNAKETYRHALAVTVMRPDTQGVPYLYTLNLSCRESMWEDLSPLFQQCVDTFRLVPPTRDYIAPDVNPWQFW